MQSTTLSLYHFGALSARLWAFAQMGLARAQIARTKGIGTWKLCGSGTGEGFTPVPNTAVYAILATWPDHDTARRALFGAPVFRRYRDHSDEMMTMFLTPTSARGRWAGKAPFEPQDAPGGPIAALTRATIKPRIAARFWGRVPGISKVIGKDPNVMFKIGIGEVPWLHQVTFSIWPDAESMAAFARHDGPHAKAIRAVRTERWFREELYARFRLDAVEGRWNGATPDFGPLQADLTADNMKVAAE
ncbi:spheroidene monooxygenase [Gymnodinialimonas sp. 2305UL16-5]|uniref:spheroidene monooxygenase n=1 Tax=Gymnodinialimonas mytili TaxID=3126503 RepID=UPI0030A25C4C